MYDNKRTETFSNLSTSTCDNDTISNVLISLYAEYLNLTTKKSEQKNHYLIQSTTSMTNRRTVTTSDDGSIDISKMPNIVVIWLHSHAEGGVRVRVRV